MNENDLTVTEWRCPICAHVNKDVYALTVEPICEQCGHEPGWNNLLTPAEFRSMNNELAEWLKD